MYVHICLIDLCVRRIISFREDNLFNSVCFFSCPYLSFCPSLSCLYMRQAYAKKKKDGDYAKCTLQ